MYEGVLHRASPTVQYDSQTYASSPQKQGYLPDEIAFSCRHPFAMQEQQHSIRSGRSQQHYSFDASESADSPGSSMRWPAAWKSLHGKCAGKRKKFATGASTSAKSGAQSEVKGTSSRTQARVQRRRNQAVNCENCRRRKLKCDQGWPCGACWDRDEVNLCTREGEARPQIPSRKLGNAPLLMRLERIENILVQLTSKSEVASTAEAADATSPVQLKGKTLAKKSALNGEASMPALKSSKDVDEAAFGLLPVSSRPVSQEQATAEMWDIMSVLPDTENVRRLCRYYFDEIDFMYYAIDEASFWMVGLREHEELRMLRGEERGRPISEKDLKRHLLFLSLLLSVCGLTLYFNGLDGFSEATAHIGHPECHNTLFDASLRAYAAANPHEQPSLLSLRCLLLQTWAIFSVRGPSVGQALLSTAIYSMYVLGLDVEPPVSMPKAQRRDRIRLFYTIATSDWFGAGIIKRSYLVREEPRRHPYLFAQSSMIDNISNVNDTILLPDMWIKLEMARINRSASDRTGMNTEDAYTATQKLQEQLNGVISALPREFEAELEKERDSADHATFHRLLTLCLVANQLINLHKRFYIQGWSDPRYESSRQICFSSARRICNLFKKTFGYIVPLDKLKNTDIAEVKRIVDNKQRQSARLWSFVHGCIGACLLLQHHCRLMDKYPDVAGPDAAKVRSEIVEDLRLMQIAMVALSDRSEIARIALTVLSKTNAAKQTAQSQTLDCIPPSREDIDPYCPIISGDECDEDTRKRRADLTQDLRSVTDVDPFAMKRVMLQSDDAHFYARSHNRSRQCDSHEGSSAHRTPSSIGRGAVNRAAHNNQKVADEVMRHIQGDSGYSVSSSGSTHRTGRTIGAQSPSEAGLQGMNSNTDGSSILAGNQSQQIYSSAMQSLLDSALITDGDKGMPSGSAFEQQAKWMGGGNLPTDLLAARPTAAFMADFFFGNSDTWSHDANVTTSVMYEDMQNCKIMPGGTYRDPLPQTPVTREIINLNILPDEGEPQMPAIMTQGFAATKSTTSTPLHPQVKFWF